MKLGVCVWDFREKINDKIHEHLENKIIHYESANMNLY